MMSEATTIHWIRSVSDKEIELLSERNPELCFERSSEGALVVSPPAGSDSGRRNATLTGLLWRWNAQTGKGIVFDSSAGFVLPDSSLLSPDASWIERSRWDALMREQQRRFSPLCPDVVMELMSPSDRGRRARERIDIFGRNGAALTVLLDPDERLMEVNGEPRPWRPIDLAFPKCETPFRLDPAELE
ncbi:MAG: Uma2 family endonuclease [Candidatus Eremiobacteraeota bacterium]|nr:Uma2 family endonuclease [Candidatus Eremiobacteraeota bacterium]